MTSPALCLGPSEPGLDPPPTLLLPQPQWVLLSPRSTEEDPGGLPGERCEFPLKC